MGEIFSVFRWQDAIDIFVVAFLIYRVLVFIRGTRALQMLIGLAILGLTFILSGHLELFALRWILNSFLSSIVLVVFILFQSEFRKGLTQVGGGTFFWDVQERLHLVEEVSRAAQHLASKKIGALIVIERSTGLKDYIETGIPIDAAINRDLIVALFSQDSRLHDGAVILRKRRIMAAGCFLPLTTNPRVSRYYGARHRAALGMSEETDAAVVLVSEEEGQVSLVTDGKITPRMDRAALQGALRELLASRERSKRRWRPW